MNKTQLIDAASQISGVSKVSAKKSIDAFLAAASDALCSGDKITLSGFGSFVVSKKPPRTGRDFRTGSPIEIPARTAIKFRPTIDCR